MRADARRNRDAILDAARGVFEVEGIAAPLDGIAARAGVGNATLYRNFPTRDDLLAAVVEDSVQELVDESEELEGGDPVDALREWMFRLTWGLRIWQDLPTCIARTMDDDGSPVQPVAERLVARTAVFLDRAVSGAEAAPTPAEVFELLTAISWGIDRFGDDVTRARARVELATAGVLARL
jgi:AcrR family transcriptional regulator